MIQWYINESSLQFWKHRFWHYEEVPRNQYISDFVKGYFHCYSYHFLCFVVGFNHFYVACNFHGSLPHQLRMAILRHVKPLSRKMFRFKLFMENLSFFGGKCA